MCESQPWCHTKGALKATLRRFPGLEVKLLCQVLNECSVGHVMPMCASQPWCHTKGGSANNIEALSGNGSQVLVPVTELVPGWLCHANMREPVMVSYHGGSASNAEAIPRNVS